MIIDTLKSMINVGNLSSSDKDEVLELQNQLEEISKALYSVVGGSKYSSLVRQIYGFDIIGSNMYMPDIENAGMTFFTRPKLNLTTTSLRHDRILNYLDTNEPGSIAFAIRCLLDPKYARRADISKLSEMSPLLNTSNPFIPILTNQLKSISGWPDVVMETETTEGGFHSENITYPKGSDDLNKTQNLTANFQDIQGSFVLFLWFMWYRYMFLISKGIISQYEEDIENKRMGFTFSIYRLVLDTSKRFVTKWAKATGCFLNTVPIGSYFNFDKSNMITSVGNDISIPITVAGKIEYMDWINLKEFNMITEDFCSNIKSWKKVTPSWRKSQLGNNPDSMEFVNDGSITRNIANHQCLPYISLRDGINELMWLYDPSERIYNGEKYLIDMLNSVRKG